MLGGDIINYINIITENNNVGIFRDILFFGVHFLFGSPVAV